MSRLCPAYWASVKPAVLRRRAKVRLSKVIAIPYIVSLGPSYHRERMSIGPQRLLPNPADLSRGLCRECGAEAELYRGFCIEGRNCRFDHDARLKGGVTRALGFGCTFVWFDPRDIFEASGWQCYICGIETPRSLYGKNFPTSPQLHHIIPLSWGGPHTPENSECCCARCNQLKGDRSLDELGISCTRLTPEILATIARSNEAPWAHENKRFYEALASSPAAIEGRLAAEESIAEAVRNGWRPPEKKIRRSRRPRIIE